MLIEAMEPDSSQGCTVKRQKTMDTDGSEREITAICKETFFTVGIRKHWSRLCREAVVSPPFDMSNSAREDLKQADPTFKLALL